MSKSNKFYGWKLLFILWIIYLLNTAFPYFGIPIVTAAMAKALNFDRSTLGMGFTFIVLAMGLPGPLIGYFVNRYGTRLCMISGSILIVLSGLYLGLYASTGLEYVLVFGLVMGFGSGLSTIIPAQTGVTLWFIKKRSLALSIIMTASGIGGFIAAPLFNEVLKWEGGWRNGWFFVAGAGTFAAILAILFVKNKPSDIGQVPDGTILDEPLPGKEHKKQKIGKVYKAATAVTLKEALKLPSMWMLLVAAIVFAWSFQLFLVHGVVHLADIGFNADVTAFSLSVLIASTVIGKLGSGLLGDLVEPRFLWSAGFILTTIAILLILHPGNVFQVYLYSVLFGIGYGASVICWITLISNYYGAKHFASILGLQMAFLTASSSAAPLLAGFIFDLVGSYKVIFLSTAFLAFIGAVFMLFVVPPKLRPVPHTIVRESP